MKINLILKKEDIEPDKMDDQKIAVVFDVLFATTTITACLEAGAQAVIPVLNEQEAREKYQQIDPTEYCLAGESKGALIDGFLIPAPEALSTQVDGKKVILSTTNGTVAIRGVSRAKCVYAASLLNTKAIVTQLVHTYAGETIVVVCAGSMNQFNLEDFYGAGYFIATLLEAYEDMEVTLSDSAKAAAMFYGQFVDKTRSVLLSSHVGGQLTDLGYQNEVIFSSRKSTVSTIPTLVKGELICLK